MKKLTPILFALLWVLGVNHCIVETAFASQKAPQSDCQSHSKDDPDSHSEGQPCAVKVLNASPTELPVIAEILVSIPTHFLSLELSSERKCIQLLSGFSKIPEPPNPLISLSIASNAPPTKA